MCNWLNFLIYTNGMYQFSSNLRLINQNFFSLKYFKISWYVSHIECEEPYFGEDCRKICTCGQGMDRCDPVAGCVCKSGSTGMNCTDDIDECDNKTICGNEKVCQNIEGSYKCICVDGFRMDGDICKGKKIKQLI